MKIKLSVARKIQYFEFGIFSYNSYVYDLTRGFIASTRAFNLLIRAFNYPTRAFSLPTRAFNLATRAFSVLTREFELVTHGFQLVTRGFELVTGNSQLVSPFSCFCLAHFFLSRNRKLLCLCNGAFKTKKKKNETKSYVNKKMWTYSLCMKKGVSSVDEKLTKKQQ